MIKATNISTAYGSRLMQDKVSFSINDGEIYGLLGGSGSGKTTLLKTMIYLNEPTTGDIYFKGINLSQTPQTKRQAIILEMGVMFQFGALFSSMTVLENIGIMLREYSQLKNAEIDEIAKLWLLKVGLDKTSATLYPSQLSGGMKKRVALARALVLSPKVLFLDEPNSGLDPLSSRALDSLICELRDSLGLSVVMVTHDIDSIFNILDRFLILNGHKIAYEGDLNGAKQLENNPLGDLFSIRKN